MLNMSSKMAGIKLVCPVLPILFKDTPILLWSLEIMKPRLQFQRLRKRPHGLEFKCRDWGVLTISTNFLSTIGGKKKANLETIKKDE
jgi:hypothetical protein